MVGRNPCIQNATCAAAFASRPSQCGATQPASAAATAKAAWGASPCGCPDALSFATLSSPNVSCADTVVAYAFAPLTPAQANVCVDNAPTTAQVVSVSVMVALFFGGPLAVLLVVGALRERRSRRRRREAAPTPTTPPTQPQHEHDRERERVLPAHVTFRDVVFSVPLTRTTTKTILKGITGELPPHTLTAIMGPSGCGKSTLLDILALRGRGKRTSGVSGVIRVNGEPRGPFWKRICAYVEQFDALFPYLTVEEMLRYTAELRLAGRSNKSKEEAVNRVLANLELTHVRSSLIGDPFRVRGISGGQARRVTVGVEMLARPSVLLLDEPTTGLDSASSAMLVRTLQKLARVDGCTIACTIHQPRSSTFALFDNLILLQAGAVAFAGPLADVPRHFAALDMPVPPRVNLADFIVDLTYDKEGSNKDKDKDTNKNDEEQTVQRLALAWDNTSASSQLLTRVRNVESKAVPVPPPLSPAFAMEGRFSQPLASQVDVLIRRSYKNLSRNTGFWRANILQSVQFLFFGLLFLGVRLGPTSNEGGGSTSLLGVGTAPPIIFKRNFMYQVMNTVCLVESIVIASAFTERAVFVREHAAGAYSVVAYHLAWYLRLMADAVWKGLLAAVLSYWFPSMRMTAGAFFFFAAVMSVTSSVGSALSLWMASMVPNAEGAANIHNTIIGFMGIYSGLYLPSRLIPVFTVFAYYISFLTYAFEALQWNEWGSCASSVMITYTLSLNPALNAFLNVLVLMAYPIAFHLLALLFTAWQLGELAGDAETPSVSAPGADPAPAPAAAAQPLPIKENQDAKPVDAEAAIIVT